MLSQGEIDALLGAVDTRAVSQLIGQAPVTLPTARKARTYDFRRPDKFSKDQLRTLQAVHDNVARLTAGRLQARLRMPVSMQLADAEQMVFDQYLQGLTLPTQLAVLGAGPMGASFLLNMDLALAFAMVDRYLGGPGHMPTEKREPTAIEAELVARAIGELIPPLDEAWAHLEHLGTQVTELALSPALLRVAAPTSVVALLTFEVRLAGQAAPISICYPYAALEPLLPRLSATAWYAEPVRVGAAATHRHVLEASLQDVRIPLRAVIGTVELPVEALAALQPGDVIRVDERVTDPIELAIADDVRTWARPGRVGDRMALQLVTSLRSVED